MVDKDINVSSEKNFISEIPSHVKLIAVTKNRSINEIDDIINSGIKSLGYSYIRDAEDQYLFIGNKVDWHFIGHLQTNIVKRAVRLFDMIETVDSIRLADMIDKECEHYNKKMPVLIEINNGRESSKTGVLPENALELAYKISDLPNLKLEGLMTMGPRFSNPVQARPYFQLTKEIFHKIKEACIPNTEMKYLSMGMSNNYKIAIQEGANIIRLWRILFE